jgi:hypothetical protein
MTAFLAICNPKKVWDFRAFFAAAPTEGFWRFSQKDFNALCTDDIIYLRVTSADREPGIHARFVATGKRISAIRSGHWRPGAEPTAPFPQALFRIDRDMTSNPISAGELKGGGLTSANRTIKVPQGSSTQITEHEVRVIEALIAKR